MLAPCIALTGFRVSNNVAAAALQNGVHGQRQGSAERALHVMGMG